jgi:hypothetical protein
MRARLALLAAAAFAAPARGAPTDWTPLTVVKASALSGAAITAQDDGSLLVSGPLSDNDTFTLELAAPGFPVTALRLEALPDRSLPAGGPGRSANGNFVLSEWRLSFGPKGSRRFKPAALWHASADFSQEGSSPLSAVDGAPATGWMIFPQVNRAHELVVETKGEVAPGERGLLVVELEFNQGEKNSLGRFRIIATGDAPPVVAAGAGPKDDTELPAQVNQAIDHGCDWLLEHQSMDGSWTPEQPNYRNGATALSVYALLKSGIRKDHPAIVRALEWMKGGEPRETYTLACQIMALHALEDPAFDALIKKLGEALLANQQTAGGFDYGFQAGGDLSNTQYAALGLRLAALHGLRIASDVWEKMAASALAAQKPDGNGAYAPLGFAYKADSTPTGSMTAAGITILWICDEQLKGHSKHGSLAALARRGVLWLAQYFGVDCNPKLGSKWQNYWLYGLERVAALLKADKIGEHDWYREGARWLVDHQKPEGYWAVSEADVLDTCWALLFLTRATAVVSGVPPRAARIYGDDRPRDAISIRASGDSPLTFWISSWGEVEKATYEWPKEEGRGLHVKSVEWFATPVGGAAGAAEIAIGKVERDARQPCGRERFGAQWSFSLPGRYRIRAVAHVAAPPAPPGEAMADADLESKPLEVHIREVLDPELMQYARDPQLDLLRNQKPNVYESSRRDEYWPGRFAVDGLLTRCWASNDADPTPTLTIELEKPVRASDLLVTPAVIDGDHPCRIAKLAVTLNGKGPPLELEMGPDDHRKSRLHFGTQIVRKIELKVVAATHPEAAHRGVGLAEVELQAEPRGRR